jgi:hypothetical protein
MFDLESESPWLSWQLKLQQSLSRGLIVNTGQKSASLTYGMGDESIAVVDLKV